MAAKRNRDIVNTWRCEENAERWSTRVCRELLELGKPATCKTHLCSKMKERLERHRLSCPASGVSGGEKILMARPQVKRTIDQAAYTARKSSVGVSTRKMISKKRKSKINSVQTSLTFHANVPSVENSSGIQSAQTNLTFAENKNPKLNCEDCQTDKEHNWRYIPIKNTETYETINSNIPIPQKETHDVLLTSGYRHRLKKITHEFFHDIPVFPDTSEMVKLKRLQIIDNFVDNIADLFIFINDEDYYVKVKHEIDKCLHVLPVWKPQSNTDKNGFEHCLRDTLLTLIRTFNENWHSFNTACFENNSGGLIPYTKDKINENIEKEISNWVENNLKTSSENDVVAKQLIKKIKPILKSRINEKPKMRAEIVNILEELSPYLKSPQDKTVYVNILASDLTNLLSNAGNKYNVSHELKEDTIFNDYKLIDNTGDETITNITDILFGSDEVPLNDSKRNVVKEIHRVLKSSGEFSDSEASSLAKNLIINVRDYLNEDVYSKRREHSHSRSFLVLTSEQELSNKSDPPFHSTPSNYAQKREIPTLNKAEKVFVEKVSAIIRTWLYTTDVSFETMEDQIFKETIVDDITNDVLSIVKQIVQLQIPGGVRIGEALVNKIILKGIMKYDLFRRQLTDESPQVVDLRQRILALDTDELLDKSALLEPQHGNRQAMANIRFRNDIDYNDDQDSKLLFQPKALDILEDNISVWINEQPSDIYKPYDKPTRNKLMRDVATNLQQKLVRKESESEIKNELAQWLSKIVKPEMQRNVEGLAEILKDKIIKLPQDETLTRAHQKRMSEQNAAPVSMTESKQHSYKDTETDQNLKEFTERYVRHYNLDDNVVNGVLELMIKRELYKLSPSTREKLYNNSSYTEFNTDEFRKELEIAKEVHDWLKNIPFYYPLLKPGPEMIEFVYSLARNIADIELERIIHPKRMDYNSWLHTEIATYMLQKDAAITNDEDKFTIDHHAGQLCLRIINLRKDEENTDELCKIITEHMKKYDALLAKDYLKKILWHRRLADNVKKLLLGQPSASREDVEKALAMIPLPRDNSVFKFKMEIKYNITIHDWFHALPIVPPKTNEEDHARKNKVQELLQKIIETDARKAENPHDTQADDDLDNYIVAWISQLQFEEGTDINVPTLISQLRSGLEYVRLAEIQPHPSSEHEVTRSIFVFMCSRRSKSHKSQERDLGGEMVEAIEKWCNHLPIKESNNEATKTKKKEIATNIFQIVGSLNDDPQVANDTEKIKQILDDEIEAQLQNLSEHKGINKNKETLKADLINKIVTINNEIRDITAGENYIQALENSIDASLPNTLHRSPKYDPGYKLFKKRLVRLWLLENYDYAVDFHSLKYKKMLSEEVNSLSKEIQNKNLFPADKDEMMNDIHSAFYNAKPPDEDAIVDEIEKIKLRCEIELWANELPLKEAPNYSKMLERDQILTLLSKILFDIEVSGEHNKEKKMRMEIVKWTQKLPILPGEKDNITKYTELLLCLLKASADSRKCQRQTEDANLTAVEETLIKLKSDEVGPSKTNKGNTSQIAGPSKPRSCGGNCGATLEQLTFLINKAINNWCAQLPLRYGVADEHNVVQGMKELISQRLFQFVTELHYRPDTLNNEGLYEHHLNLEIEGILTQLANDRAYWEEQHSRNDRKYQLINALKAIRPLVQQTRSQEMYREKLRHTISNFHESMNQFSAGELSENTQMAILDDFLQYKEHKGDFETQELYRIKINEELNNELNVQNVDPLLATNRLLCELSKVEPPAHSGAQRRYSEPYRLSVNRLPSAPPLRRHSLPYPPPNYGATFVPSQNIRQTNMPVPKPLYPRGYHAPLSTSLPGPRIERPPNFRQSMPMTRREIRPHLRQELPILYPSSGINIRPFPVPPPVFNQTNDSVYQSPGPQIIYRRPENEQNFSSRGFVEQPSREPETVEQQIPLEQGARVINTERTRNETRSVSDCPKERQFLGGQGHQYCETCARDDDCAYNMPYPPRMGYMYF